MEKKIEKLRVWSYSQSHRLEGEGHLVERANDFFEKAEIQGVSMDTVRSYAYALLSLFRFIHCDWVQFENFNQKLLQDWMIYLKKQKKLQARSINLRLCSARVFYQFCFGKPIPHAPGVLYPRGHYRGQKSSPLRPGRRRYRATLELRMKTERKMVDPLKPKEIDLFLQSVHRYRDFGIALTMLLCGLRSQEVILLRMEDVDFHQNMLRVRGKGKRERMIPMPYRLMQLYERYLELERPSSSEDSFFVILQGKRYGKSLTRATIRRIFRYRREKLGINKLRPHQFRHAFASDMARTGMPITSLQRLMGHADLTTTQIYINLFLDDIRAEYEKAIHRIEGRYAALSKK